MLAGAACGVAFSTHYYCVFLAIPLALVIVQGWRPLGWIACLRQLTVRCPDELRGFPCAVAVSARRAADGVARHHRESADRHRPRGCLRRVRAQPADTSRCSGATPSVNRLRCSGSSEWCGCWPRPRRARSCCWHFRSRFCCSSRTPRRPAAISTRCCRFSRCSRRGRLSNLAARIRGASPALFWIAVALAAAPGFQASVRSDAFLRQRRHADAGGALHRSQSPARVDDPDAALLVGADAVSRRVDRGPRSQPRQRRGEASTKFQLQLALDPYPSPAYRLIYLGRGGLDADKIYVDPALLGGSEGLEPLRRLGVTYVLVKRYNRPDPETLPFLAALSREGRRIAVFSPYRPGISEAEQARIDPFLHNTDARIDDALERPGPPLEIWQLNAPGT